MRREIIKRFAAGTFSICFAYAMIRQPFDTIMGTSGEAADWKQTTISGTTETAPPSSMEEAKVDPFPAEETTEDVYYDAYEDTYEDETQITQQDEEAVGKPTLSQFLSVMICGGCHRRCLLISPGCMRGQMKAENATEEYYDTYGE